MKRVKQREREKAKYFTILIFDLLKINDHEKYKYNNE